jgi:nitrogen-specific signal transduction histidine kinase
LQGTGLGLAIVQSVVSDHHGAISVTSDEGRGTTFRIDLPQRQAGKTATPREAAPEKKSTPSTLAAASD